MIGNWRVRLRIRVKLSAALDYDQAGTSKPEPMGPHLRAGVTPEGTPLVITLFSSIG
jgi:hypothetical protein